MVTGVETKCPRVTNIAPLDRGLKHPSRTMSYWGFVQVTNIAPLDRGLKLLVDPLIHLLSFFVTNIAPLDRGLKLNSRETKNGFLSRSQTLPRLIGD